jgi:hypothetical protein
MEVENLNFKFLNPKKEGVLRVQLALGFLLDQTDSTDLSDLQLPQQ